MIMSNYYVYIMSNQAQTLYIGVTNELYRRVTEHKQKVASGFTSRYNLTKLVYYETTENIHSAITREKELKGWKRSRKIALIQFMNINWKDLSADWYEE